MKTLHKATFALFLILVLLTAFKQTFCQTPEYRPRVQVDVTSSDDVLRRSATRTLTGWLRQINGLTVTDKPSDYLLLVYIEPAGSDGLYAMNSFAGRQADCAFRPHAAVVGMSLRVACIAVDEFKTVTILRVDQIMPELREIVSRFNKGVLDKDRLFFKPTPAM